MFFLLLVLQFITERKISQSHEESALESTAIDVDGSNHFYFFKKKKMFFSVFYRDCMMKYFPRCTERPPLGAFMLNENADNFIILLFYFNFSKKKQNLMIINSFAFDDVIAQKGDDGSAVDRELLQCVARSTLRTKLVR